jgi:hypothetical protein
VLNILVCGAPPETPCSAGESPRTPETPLAVVFPASHRAPLPDGRRVAAVFNPRRYRFARARARAPPLDFHK